MSEDVNLPGVDKPAEAVAETAKLGQSLATLVQAGGEWASAVAGNLPHNLVGILGDKVRAYRIERAYILRQRVIERLKKAGYERPEELNATPSLLLPMLESAVDEERPVLQDLWEKLIAAASSPDRKERVRQSFIEILKRMDPADALMLQCAEQWTKKFSWRSGVAGVTRLDPDEIEVSLLQLKDLGLIGGDGGAIMSGNVEKSGYELTPTGRLFLKAVED